jgi:hypothetical protein
VENADFVGAINTLAVGGPGLRLADDAEPAGIQGKPTEEVRFFHL